MLDSSEILLRVTCSRWAFSEVSSSMLYLARILRMGRSFSHHCSLGMRCLGGRERAGRWSRMETALRHPGERSQPLFVLPGAGARSLRWGGGEGGHLLEVCLLLELGDGLEDEAALAHAQQTSRVVRVGEDPTCEGRWGGGSASRTLQEGRAPLKHPPKSADQPFVWCRSTRGRWERDGALLLAAPSPAGGRVGGFGNKAGTPQPPSAAPTVP